MFLTIFYIDSVQRDGRWAVDLQNKLKSLPTYRSTHFLLLSRRNTWILPLLSPHHLIVIGQLNISYELSQKVPQAYISFIPAECWLSEAEYEAMYPNEKYLYNNLNSIYFWGRKSLHWFSVNRLNHNPSISLNIIGYPRQQYLEEIKHNRIEPSLSTIGLVGRFSGINDLYHRSALSLIQRDITNYASNRLLVEVKVFSYYQRIISECSPLMSFSLRPHPNEDPYKYDALDRCTIDRSIDNIHWFGSIAFLVGCLSTSIIDAYFAGIPYICVDKLVGTLDQTLSLEPALSKTLPFCIMPETEEELHSLLWEKNSTILNRISPSPTELSSLHDSFEPRNLMTSETAKLITKNFIYAPTSLLGTISLPARYLLFYLFLLIDCIHQIFHLFSKPYRLSFDYSRIFHVFK